MASLVALNRKKGSLKAQLTRLETLLQEESVTWTKIKIETKIKALGKMSSNIEELRSEYYSTIPPDQDLTEIENSLLDLDERLEQLEVRFNELLTIDCVDNPSNSSEHSRVINSCKIQLPQISLPLFEGRYEQWHIFKTEFNNIITNNKELSDVQKLHYLRAAIKGIAKQMETPQDTFESLFSALERRFENKRIVVNIHIKSILEFEKITYESSKDLRHLVDVVHKSNRALSNLGFEKNNLSDILLVTVILEKLDRETRKQFELSINTSEVPDFDNLMSFLEKRSQTLESISKNVKSKVSGEIKTKSLLVNNSANFERRCVVCNSPHPLFKCDKFIGMNHSERFDIIKKNKLCLSCFSSKHFQSSCTSFKACNKCNSKSHHSLLHRNDSFPKENVHRQTQNADQVGREEIVTPSPPTQLQATNLSNSFSASNKHVVLSTAMISIQTCNGNFIEGRGLLDSCSQIHCVSSSFAKQLGLRKTKTIAPISGLNGTSTTLNYKIKSVIANKNRDFMKELEFFIVPKITDVSPVMPIHVKNNDIPKNICLADVKFNIPGKIDLLIGAECFFDLLKSGKIRCEANNLLFQETQFGYVASGVVNNTTPDSQYCGLLTQNDTLEQTLQKFWEVESVGAADSLLSKEEQFCEKHFKETHYRTADGQYVVTMPMEDSKLLGESKGLAQKRLEQIWTRLERDSNLQLLYSEFMAEYERLHHMQLVEGYESEKDCFYLPHHGVYRPEKSSTRLRVVFNATAATSSGLSLNDILLKGKIPQQELFLIMIRFRKHRYAFTADVEKMYRMILVNPSQRNLLRILWKERIDSPVQIYKLNTITYGTSSAPYLATRTLKQLALDEQKHLPLASSVVLTDFYIDDLLSGEATLEGAKLLQSQIIELLKLGKMNLHKWCANHPDLLVSKKGVDIEYSFDDQPECNSVKTLGVLWNPKTDCFLYKLKIPEKDSYSKRDVLSHISKIFDPLGLIGPVVARAKMFMQRLWLSKIDWNEPLPESLVTEWSKYVSTLSEIRNLEIPRYVFREERIVLHGYADASSSAYAAAIYVQSIPVEGSPTARLLCSKSRVAPLKTLSIPRLELCGCLLLSKLVYKVLPSLNVPIEKVVLWTDSMICLAWIKKPPHLLKTFVGNRIASIQELTAPYEWYHVTSDNNPADVLSRGLDPKDILSCDLWWYGPDHLREELQLVEQPPVELQDNTDYAKELKPLPELNFKIMNSNPFLDIIFNFSNNYMKLIRIISYLYRFLKNSRKGQVRVEGPITLEEVRKAEVFIIREVQKGEFVSEVASLKRGKQISPRSKLRSLNAFLDKDEILRIGSRIAYSQVSYNSKFPIILPAKHRLTRLIMSYYHVKQLHLGPQALLNAVRQKFWPISGRNLARKIVHDCVQCFKHRPVPVDQLMGNLPAERVVVESTFNKTGLDFCGPFLVRSKNQRRGTFQKMYVAVFVCLATRAIHLEIVSDLSTEALVATLKRFFARRGKCSTIFSDNATNFCGARNELKRMFKLVRFPESGLTDYLLAEEVEWKFIPPRAPHFGGLWEAGVKCFKTHLKKTVGDSKLTLEEFLTLVTQIEGILNSRPITPLSSDARDFNALTPGHFLIGRPITAPVEPDITNQRENRLTRWERVTKMVQNIWKKWQRDYLSQLHERTKWQFTKGNVTPGTVVLVKEDNLPVCHWVLGRVEETIPGLDNRVRVVKVRTAKGLFKRAVTRLSILPINDT